MSTGIPNAERQQAAQRRAEDLAGRVLPLRADGKSLREIAAAMTEAGIPTANGGEWSAQQVQRILLRLDQRPAPQPEYRDPLAELAVPEQPAPAPDGDPLAAMPLSMPRSV